MQIRSVVPLAGPNVWNSAPVLEVALQLAGKSSRTPPEVAQRVAAALGQMTAHLACADDREDTLTAIRTGADQPEVLLRATLLLQHLASSARIEFGLWTTDAEGRICLAIGYEEESFGRACLDTAVRLCQAASASAPFDAAAELQKLRDLSDQVCLGPSTRAIVDAAAARGIPARRLNTGSLVQLGYASAQRRVWAAETDRTTAIGEAIAKDKGLTKSLLQSLGLPVPQGRVVDSADDAWEAACDIGLPVVVKPRDANHGRGVFINVSTRERIADAYEHAAKEGDGVLVEQFARGTEHRLLVVGKKLVAAARGEPDQVVGDGKHSIAELIDELNRDPRRSGSYASPLYRVDLGPIALTTLEQQGFTPDSVPPEGASVLIHYNGDLTTDVTDQVHPDIAAQAVLAARIVGLDIAGIDLVAADIGQPLAPQGGMILEVNAGPSLQSHVEPQRGRPQPVGAAIIDLLFPDTATGRVPMVAVAGDAWAEPAARLVAHLLRQNGRRVGLASERGCYSDDRLIEPGRATGSKAASLLLNPLLEALVFQVSDEGILTEGLVFDRVDVAVFTDIAASNAGEGDAPPWHDRVFVRRVLVESQVAGGVCVLPAAEPWAPLVAEHAPGATCLFSADGGLPLVQAHLRGGGQVVYVRDGQIVLATGAAETALVPVASIAALTGARAMPLPAVLAAVAAGWSAGVADDQLRQGLQDFLP